MRPTPKRIFKIVLFVICFLITTLNARAQDARVVFPDLTITLKDGFEEIEKQTNYLISVNNTSFDLAQKVKLTRNNISVKDALTQLLSKSKGTFVVRGNHIAVVSPKEKPEDVINAIILPENLDDFALPDHKTPIDVDSLERALLERKIDYPAEIPPSPELNKTVYYYLRDIRQTDPGTPAYVRSMPRLALRTNLLYGFGTLTPNLGVEIGLAPKSSLLVSGSYNGWNEDGLKKDNKKFCHWIAEVEYRYWTCERFNGHFFGVHGFFGHYNISRYKLPLVFESDSKDYSYKGTGFGAGVSYGYQMMLGKKWNLEFNAGIGIGMLNYDKSECERCGTYVEKNVDRTFVAPTKLGISLVYFIK